MTKYKIALLLSIVCVFGLCISAFAQNESNENIEDVRGLWVDSPINDFAELQRQMTDYYRTHDKGKGSGYKQWKRWEHLNSTRLTPDGKIFNWAKKNFDEYHQYNLQNNTNRSSGNSGTQGLVNTGSWYSLAPASYVNGPSGYLPGLGRINCIAFHPTLASTIYVGCPSGGLWRSTNTGGAWTALTDGIPSIGVSGIAIDHNNPNIIYILTGDGDGADTYSTGVLKSLNGGQTWLSTGLSWNVTNNIRGYKLLMHPTNSNILFAVTNTGLFRTSNGGATWVEEDTGSWRDLEFKPGDPNIMYLAGSTFKRSTDNGLNWTQITSGVPTGTSRMAIAVSPNNSNYVYIVAGPGGPISGQFKGTYRSFDSGLNFTLRATTPNILNSSLAGTGTSSQYTYDLAIAVNPTSVGNVFTGGINVWESNDFAVNFSIVSHWNINTAASNGLEFTHGDIHGLDFNPLDDSFYCLSDGGIYRSTNYGTTWTDISSGLRIMQFYKIASTPQTTNLIIGGSQDNGSNEWDGGTSVDHMYGADGMDCMIDPTNSNIYYFSTQNGGLRKSTNGGATSFGIKPTGASGSWVTPYVMDPNNSSVIYAGYSDIYKSVNGGSSWTVATTFSGSGCLAHGTNNSNRVYASSGSSLYMTNNAGSTWTLISGGLPSQTITGITINPDNSPEVIVTLSGFVDGQKVYRSANAGTSWTNITGSLPNVPVNCIAFEDNNGSPDDALYIGTDIGVFYRNSTLGDWLPFSNWLPTVPVFDLEIHQTAGLITAGTYGRGLWRSSTYTDCQTAWNLSGNGNPGYSYYQASDSIRSTRQFVAGIGQSGHFKAANKVRLTTGFEVSGGSIFKGWIGPCGTGIPLPVAGIPLIGFYEGPMNGVVNENEKKKPSLTPNMRNGH